MSQNPASLTDPLLENEEYQRLHQQHQDYESRLTTPDLKGDPERR